MKYEYKNVNANPEIAKIYEGAEKFKADLMEAFKCGTAQIDLWLRAVLKDNGLDGEVRNKRGNKGRLVVENGSLAFVFESRGKKVSNYKFHASDWLKWECATSPQAIMNRLIKEYEAV